MQDAYRDKTLVELRTLAQQAHVPNYGRLRTKKTLCDALAAAAVAAVVLVDEDNDDLGSDDTFEVHEFAFPRHLKHMSDAYHWQRAAVASQVNGFYTLDVDAGTTFWHGTRLVFPNHVLPFGASFYGDIETTKHYAHVRARAGAYDAAPPVDQGYARIISARNTHPLSILKMSSAANVARLGRLMSEPEEADEEEDEDRDGVVPTKPNDLAAFVPLLNYAFPLHHDEATHKRTVSRVSESRHDAALNYGLQTLLARFALGGWCALNMRAHRGGGQWNDEIVFHHGHAALVRGPDEMLLVPRYPGVVLHFCDRAFVGLLDARLGETTRALAINVRETMHNLPAPLRTIPELVYISSHLARLDAAYLTLMSQPIASAR
jgi:hypothetical protein